jgi:glycosyltransferase involved in cell wall biosynthesis
MPLFTVIIPTYNRSTLLTAAIESLRSQEFQDFELIVVDDGSTDDTAAVLKTYTNGGFGHNFRALRQSNAGQGTARNLGIAQAQGKYCVFLDSDDLFLPWSLALIAQAIEENGRPPLVMGREFRFKEPDDLVRARREPLRVWLWPEFHKYAMHNAVGGAGVTVARTSLLRKIGGFVAARIIGEDTDLLLRLGDVPVLRIEAPATYAYRLHPGMFTASKPGWHGALLLLRHYRAGLYPGDSADACQHLARIIGYWSYACLYHGHRRDALNLFFRSLDLQARAGHHDFILKMPFRVALSLLGRWPRGGAIPGLLDFDGSESESR